ncbi:YdcF family protein [Allosediminivita pacifica]|uniref:DUF218 domain-containing protein n=1 Tax=Allosediminivita pacifica TaxID=1267769 RepID=A0A2T6B2I0_9RHOB|nr:YdcF family protein [Allosediminivita pacifica]PTX50286.1 DUF218 domain-containing protein [Allosediminivita pacifica]GGB02916.1 hypothetical protein GCM10011324_11410 [Allosediminivita pacifica]
MKKRLAVLLLLLVVPPLATSLGSAYFTTRCDRLHPSSPYDVAVILSAGLRNDEVDSRPGMITAARTAAGVALYQGGVVRRLHMTGDASYDPDIAVAWGMRDMAIAQGIPAAAISVEDRSQSTLQNALFSEPQLRDAGRILLVSSGYHLWRGAFSMAWAGVPIDRVCKSSAFDPVPFRGHSEILLSAIPKWWLNLGRALIWSAASGIGLQDRLPPWFLD